MGYNKSTKELIKSVNGSRQNRINQDFSKLNLSDRRNLLESFHPDHIQDKKRKLRIGPNTGDQLAHELVNILESYSFIDPKNIDLDKHDFEVDVLVVGAGGAGISAAIESFHAGANVMLVTKLRLGDANTVMAQGGIQAADKENDSPITHYLDVMGGGHFTNTPALVKALTESAPETISWLENLGVIFDKKDDGEMITIHGGGTSRKRMHSARDYTGLEILRVIRDEFLNFKIPYLEFCSTVELIKDVKGNIAGALLYNMETQQIHVCKAKTVILATGGMGRLHVQNFPCSNHYGATADGIALASRAGVPFVFMNSIQYHPTGAAYPEQILGLLVTEKVRGLGAQLVNADGERFIYELLPRDIVSSVIIKEVGERKKGVMADSGIQGVWLDSPLIDMIHGKGTARNILPAMYTQYEKFGIKIDEEPILVYPTQHYQNGGLKINEEGQTNIANLFAAGEVSGGIHGENRLMGNSLLDILVFGRRAGKRAARLSKQIVLDKLTLRHVVEHNKKMDELDISKECKSPILLPSYNHFTINSAKYGT
ncbi:FAD-binding protein, partial [bacterium]